MGTAASRLNRTSIKAVDPVATPSKHTIANEKPDTDSGPPSIKITSVSHSVSPSPSLPSHPQTYERDEKATRASGSNRLASSRRASRSHKRTLSVSASSRHRSSTQNFRTIPPLRGGSAAMAAPASNRWVIGRTEDISLSFGLGEKLGEGKDGTIFLATELKTGKKFACKVISTKVKRRARATYFRRLRLELEILRKLDHPHVCNFHYAFEDESNLYLIIELSTGGELLQRIGNGQSHTPGTSREVERSSTPTKPSRHLAPPGFVASNVDGSDDDELPATAPQLIKAVTSHGSVYSEKRVAVFLRQIVLGIQYLHAHKIVHCDLKPENVLFADRSINSKIVIIDFGLARMVDSEGGELTGLRGTPFYVAPEVIEGSYSEACDMWSFGVLTFLLLCGRPPFLAHTTDEVYSLITQGFNPVSLAGDGPHFPSNLALSAAAKDLISKLLVNDPLRRLTAGEALDHSWLTGVDAAETPLGGVIRNMANFTRHYKLKGGDGVPAVTKEDLQALRATFKQLGLDGDQSTTLAEIQHAMEDDTRAAQVEELFKIGESGQLSFNELVKLSVTWMRQNKADRLKRALMDTGKGTHEKKLTELELMEVLKVANEAATLQEVRALVVEANGDGVIDFDEFCALWLHKQTHELTSV